MMLQFRRKYYISKFGPKCPVNGWHIEKYIGWKYFGFWFTQTGSLGR